MAHYRIFTNDVGPNAYSALKDVVAPSPEAAIAKVKIPRAWRKVKVIACDFDQMQHWPDGKTGKLPRGAAQYVGAR